VNKISEGPVGVAHFEAHNLPHTLEAQEPADHMNTWAVEVATLMTPVKPHNPVAP
jgi:hypothetical protein